MPVKSLKIVCTFLGLCVFLIACSEPAPSGLRFGLASMPSNLDPRYATDAASSRIGRLVFQRLVDFNAAKQPVPAIASWKKLNDKHYRFVLNNSVRPFHNGATLSSKDVKATYDFILDKTNASPHRAALALIESIETPDERTVDFILNRSDPLFPGYLVVGIVPVNLINEKHDFARNPVGSGLFSFESQSQDGKLTFKRLRDNFSVTFIYVPNPTVRVLKLLRGEIDIVQNDMLPELVTYLENKQEVKISKIHGANFSYIGFNMQDSALKQLSIRQAIAMGINREEIIEFVFGNSARMAEAILPPDHWAGNKHLAGYSYDPDKARQLLRNAGYTQENPLQLTFKTSSDPFRLRIATIYQDQLAKIGVNLDIRSYDWGTFYGDIKAGRFQLYSLAWIGIKTPDIFRYTTHSSAVPPNGANRGRYLDSNVDRLIETAENSSDLGIQAKVYAQLQAYLLKQLPYVPLWYEDHIVIQRKNVKNYSLSSDGNYDGLLHVSL